MLISSRGVNATTCNMIKELERILISVRESKHDRKDSLHDIVELMDMNDCTNAIYFETTKRIEYIWIMGIHGPSIRFIAYNLFTMKNLRFPINCEKNAGHKLFFDENFNNGNLEIVKNLFMQTFKESEVFDRLICFYYLDNKIWMRLYVIENEVLKEMGPRMVVEVDKILEGSFDGKVLFKRAD